jgi:putative ABC transport system permease protein
MLKNYLKIAYRNLNRNKGFSILNITGLAIGMASAILILLWVQNELSFDRFYKNSNRLYQVWGRNKSNHGIDCTGATDQMMTPALRKDYPEVEKACRVHWEEAPPLSTGEKKMYVKNNIVDPDFLTMFGFPLLKGNVNSALSHPYDIVITEKLAKKLFGNEDGMGKKIRLFDRDDFIVSAIMKDLPNNTQFGFEYLVPWSYMKTTKQAGSNWGETETANYVLLKPYTDLASVNLKIENIVSEHRQNDWTTKIFLYPVSRLHLYSNFVNGKPVGGKIELVKIFSLIAGFILLIACINFMNMSTARSERRAKEVGIRKVAGAMKNSLILQFITESILISSLAGLIALVIVSLSLPAFNALANRQLFIDFGRVYFWLFFLGFILFTGLVAGSYPAFFLSSFKPVAILKGSFKKAEARVTPRKILVVGQFSFAIVLIVCTIIIQHQIKYARDREIGYNKDKLLNMFTWEPRYFDMIKRDLLSQGIAESATKTSGPLSELWFNGFVKWEGRKENDKTEFIFLNQDGGLVKTAGLQLVKGRDIDLQNYPTDSNAVILNETAVKVMAFKNPIGQTIDRGYLNTDWHVVGVIKDFILESPYDPVKPIVIRGPKAGLLFEFYIKLNNSNTTADNLTAMEKVFKRYMPNFPFEYRFADEAYARKFGDEKTIGTLTALFAGLTIFISCLGIFGLVAYMAERRIKEIGIRKVLGASVSSITVLLSGDFIKLVFIAICIATPVAWLAMNKWLKGYNYHIDISPWTFLVAGFSAILIAVITVSFQAIKAAVANPVISLRSE